MDAPISEDKLASIKEALFQGKKILAIKLYREATGTGLAEAKDAVDKMEQELKRFSPEKFAAPSRTGCFGVLVAVCSLALTLLVLALLHH